MRGLGKGREAPERRDEDGRAVTTLEGVICSSLARNSLGTFPELLDEVNGG